MSSGKLQSRFEPPISRLHTKPNLTASETMKVRQWKVGGDGGRRVGGSRRQDDGLQGAASRWKVEE